MNRPWIKQDVSNGHEEKFTLVTMNILAHGLDEAGGFDKVSDDDLRWDLNRANRTLECILMEDPDIVCLQEVNHFDDFILPRLTERGYFGVFKDKQNSPCLGLGFPADGCACFWKLSKFKHWEESSHNYQNSNQVYQLIKLKSVKDTCLFIVNTHLKSKKEYEHVRLEQLTELAEKITKTREDVGVIVAGDMNTQPLGVPITTFKGITGLKSAYRDIENSDLFYTSWKIRRGIEYKYAIDHILHSDNVKIHEMLGVPPNVPASRLPCHWWSSDHISLGVICSVFKNVTSTKL